MFQQSKSINIYWSRATLCNFHPFGFIHIRIEKHFLFNLHGSQLCKCENCNNRSLDSEDEEYMINSNYEDENMSDEE